MKILMINVVCGVKSTGRICAGLAKALEQKGHTVKIAYGRGKVPEHAIKYAVRIGSLADIGMHALEARCFDGAGCGSRAAAKHFVRWVKEFGPDVIHLHNLHGYYLNIRILFDFLKDYPGKVLWTMHDGWAFTGHGIYCEAIGCMRWKKGCYDCPQHQEYPRSLTDRSYYNWKKKRRLFCSVSDMELIAPSEWMADCIRQSFLKKYPVRVIPNGIDTGIFHYIPDSAVFETVDDNKFIILGVTGLWNDMKGFSDFLKLAGRLDESFQIVMAGLDEKQAELLPAAVTGLKSTDSAQKLADIYSKADVFLNLTYCDTYPTVNLEARACGLSVITYQTGGSPEAGGPSCRTVPKGDLDGIVRELRHLKESIGKCTHAVESRELEMLDEKNALKAYVEVIEDVTV